MWYPFGRTQTASPQATFQVSSKFTGQILDAETGLYYYGARYYDPELGRFTQPDTVIPDLGNPQSYNRYSYTLNNPLKYVDPDGHSPREILESAGNFAGGALYGVANVLNPVPVQIRGEGPPPSSTAEYYGRRAGETAAVGISLFEIYGGGSLAALGGTVAGGGALATAGTGGAASPVSVPAMVVGGVVVVGGAVITTHGVIGVNNFMSIHTQKPANKASNRSEPAPDNYRGRYNAARNAEGKARLPDDWDVHHRIPQAYRDDPQFKGFDFDAPSNTQGIKGSRSSDGVNRHQFVTNEWESFRKNNQNASRSQIEGFAANMDEKFAADWLK